MATLSIPNSFSAGTTILSSAVNANFTAISNIINGNIDNTNFGTFSGVVTWSIAANVLGISMSNSGTEGSASFTHSGVLGSGKATLKVASAAAQVSGDALVKASLSNASSSIPTALLEHAGTGPLLKGDHTGSGNLVDIIDSGDSDAKRLSVDNSGIFLAGMLRMPGTSVNLALARGSDATKIKVTGANGSALSATNPGYVALESSVTAGQIVIFRVEADVTIDLTGAHWGLDGLGDRTDIELRVLAINDSASLKWGITNKGGYRALADTNSTATASSATTQAKALVNGALNSGTWPCREVGWFLGDFTDASNEWSVQNGVGNLNVGIPVRDHTDWEAFTPTGSWSTNTSYFAARRRVGDCEEYDIRVLCSGAPTAATLTVNLPSNRVVDTTKTASSGTANTLGVANILDSGLSQFAAHNYLASTTTIGVSVINSSATYASLTNVTQAVPITFGAADAVHMQFSVPIVGWSAN